MWARAKSVRARSYFTFCFYDSSMKYLSFIIIRLQKRRSAFIPFDVSLFPTRGRFLTVRFGFCSVSLARYCLTTLLREIRRKKKGGRGLSLYYFHHIYILSSPSFRFLFFLLFFRLRRLWSHYLNCRRQKEYSKEKKKSFSLFCFSSPSNRGFFVPPSCTLQRNKTIKIESLHAATHTYTQTLGFIYILRVCVV